MAEISKVLGSTFLGKALSSPVFSYPPSGPRRLYHYSTETAAKVARVGLVALARGRSYAISGAVLSEHTCASKHLTLQRMSQEVADVQNPEVSCGQWAMTVRSLPM